MNITRESLESQVELIKVTVALEDYSESVEKKLKDYKKKSQIPGYRPGMVPMGVIKKMYGKGVTAEEAHRVAVTNIYKFIQENNIETVGEPMPSDKQVAIDFDNSTEFEFAYEIGIAPAIEIDLSSLELKKYDVQPDQETFDAFKDNFVRRFGKLVDKEEVLLDEALSVNLDNEEMNIEDAYVGLVSMSDEERAPFIGKKVGDKLEINVNELYKAPSQRASILSVKEEELEGINPNFTLTITRVRKFENPELNDEFFAEAFEDKSITNEEQFNSFINAQIAKNLSDESSTKMIIDGKATIVEAAKLEYPNEFLKKWLVAVNEGKLDAESIEKEFPAFLDYLAWANICSFYAKEASFEVTPEEIKTEAKVMAKMQFAYYGMANPEEEMLDNYANSIVANQEESRRIQEAILTKKCVEYIATKATIKSEEISYKDFAALAQQ